MADLEKVLKGLGCCTEHDVGKCLKCPYGECLKCSHGVGLCHPRLAADVLELLKEQPEQKHGHWISVPDKSPKTTTINMYSFICSCSECGQSVGHHIEYNYCPRCGAKMDEEVKQDG